jgi:hypothetical protein
VPGQAQSVSFDTPSYQHVRLRVGKRAATARVGAERARPWQASHLALAF